MKIEPAQLSDWDEIKRIYIDGIRTKNATFEQEADIPEGADWFAKKVPGMIFKAIQDNGRLQGWSALTPVSSRCVYEGVAEVSVYVAAAARGQGIGKILLKHLVNASEAAGVWTLQAGIFPENEASIKLHQACGFRILGTREKLGKLDGTWRDVVFMERRSPKII